MPVDFRSAQHESGLKWWILLRQFRGARGWLLVAIPAVLLLTVAALPVFGAGLLPALRSPLLSRSQAPQAISWSGFSPAGWVTALPVASSVTAEAPGGLDPVTARYAVSTDGGVSWSAWTAAGLSVTGAVSTTQTLAVTGLTFPDSATLNLIRYQIQEIGGTLESSPDFTVQVDTTPPATPLGLTATPGTWTNVASFGASWTNPSDASGVAGAWYKLDSAPTTDTDGTFVAGAGLTNIDGIQPSTDGAHPIYIWLQDSLGRADHTHAASTTLYLDRTPPPPPFNLQGVPARTWTHVNSFAETWTNPSDLSGIVGAYYRVDQPGAFPTDGTFASTVNTLSNIAVPADGKHDLYIWLVDAAGNVSHLNRNVDPQVFWYDGTLPTSTVGVTLAPPLVAIAGTATDIGGSGVGLVSVSIRDAATGLYWDGADWVSGEQWLAAAGTATWNYAGAQPAWTNKGTYTVRSQATDVAGNAETPGIGSTFVYDTTPPGVTLTAPNGGEILAGGQPYTVTWTITQSVTLPSNPITLSVSYNGGVDWTVIASGLSNTGSHIWTPPGIVNTDQALVQVEVVDQAGNHTSDRSDTFFTIDSDPPAAPLNLMAMPATWTNVDDFSIVWTNPPDVSPVAGAWYKLDSPPLSPHDGTYITGTSSISGIKPATDGAHMLYVWLQDTLNRADQNANTSTTLYLDRTSPAPPSGLIGTPARVWTNVNSFAERWTNPPDASGIVGAYYRFDQPGSFPTDGTFVSTTNTLSDIIVPGDGKHDLYIWLGDAAGNVSHLNRNLDPQVFWYDGTPATSSIELTPPLPANGWYSGTVSAAFQGQDTAGGSGLANVYHRLDDGDWDTTPSLQVAAEGQHAISYFAQDIAGNGEISKTVQLALDLTPPAVSLTAARPPQATGWYTAPITFNLAVTDTLSGDPHAYFRLNGSAWQSINQFQLISDGRYTIDYYGRDAAGNRSAVGSQQVPLDTTPPSTAYLIEGTQGQNGWYTSQLTVKLIASDTGSGIAATYYRINDGPWQTGTQFQLTADGYYTLSFYSVDVAGNVETSFPVQVKIDTAAPGTPIAIETIPGTWNRVNQFSVQWANSTDLSGVAGVYYRLDTEPTGSSDGTFSPQTNRLDGLSVPSEGVHHLFLWLRDAAGNADYHTRAEAPLLRYDATPPTTTATIQGVTGTDGWYRSPVTVTLHTVDSLSGITLLRYRLDDGDWITTTLTTIQLSIATSDKHILEFGADDVAGNVESTHSMTVRIDANAPAAPDNVRAEPAGWHHWNDFTVRWTSPLDQSGIAGAYVKFDAPPTDSADGTFYPGSEAAGGVQVPGEGKHSAYVWLRDGAGNSDSSTAVALPDALWYDATPPATIITRTGTAGQYGWYLGPVSFAMTATDAASGLAAIRYQVDDGPWTAGSSFVVGNDGQHVVRISSTDIAGNVEPAHVFAVNVDHEAPTASLNPLYHYQSTLSFDVSWQGTDPTPGSGLAAFDVQVRDGYTGDWQNWQSNTTATTATYSGQRGHTYFFRVAARDQAGNRQPFTAGDTYTMIETVHNGSFDTGNFTEWDASGTLFKAVVPTTGPYSTTIFAARLGTDAYGPSLPSPTDPGSVPIGNAAISQAIRVPDLSQAKRPTLTFWYRILTYDVLYSKNCTDGLCDSLDVSAYDAAGTQHLLLRDGNPTKVYGQLYDTGWKRAIIDLRSYAGQTVRLDFSNWNRNDNLFNTWSFVDDIRVSDWPLYGVYLSLIEGSGSGTGGAAAASGESPAQAVPPPAENDGKR